MNIELLTNYSIGAAVGAFVVYLIFIRPRLQVVENLLDRTQVKLNNNLFEVVVHFTLNTIEPRTDDSGETIVGIDGASHPKRYGEFRKTNRIAMAPFVGMRLRDLFLDEAWYRVENVVVSAAGEVDNSIELYIQDISVPEAEFETRIEELKEEGWDGYEIEWWM
jgi:hypothetical protein